MTGNGNNNNFDKEKLIKQASKSLGADEERVKKAIDSGNFKNFTDNLPPDKSRQLNEILNDEQKLKQMLSTPQAKALFKKLMG